MDLDRKTSIRRGDEDAPGDPAELVHEPALGVPVADVLDDSVREGDLELCVGERERATIGANGRHAGKRGLEPLEILRRDSRDPLGPGVDRLEEVMRSVHPLAGPAVGDPDVHDRRLRCRRHVLEEELHLSAPTPSRDAGSELLR